MVPLRKQLLVIFLLIFSSFVYADLASCSGPVPEKTCKEYGLVTRGEKELCEEIWIKNCCPNTTCDDDPTANYKENYGGCPADCEPKDITLKPIVPAEAETFYRGENAQLKFEVTAEGAKVIGAEITANSPFFKNLQILNDGQHEDGTNLDNTYANNFKVPSEAEQGSYDVALRAKFRSLDLNSVLKITIMPQLQTDVKLNDTYVLGDIIDYSGKLFRKKEGVKASINVKISADDKIIHEETVQSGEDGSFTASFHTSQVHPTDDWALTMEATDEFNNSLKFSKKFEVVEAKMLAAFTVEVLGNFSGTFKRGSSLDVKAAVKDFLGKPVKGATVTVTTPAKETIALSEGADGEYAGLVNIGFDSGSGRKLFIVKAAKSEGALASEGQKAFEIVIEAISLVAEIKKPELTHFRIGDVVPIEAIVKYPNGEKVKNATVQATFKDQNVALKPIEAGVFSGSYKLEEKDEGKLDMVVSAIDESGNSGTARAQLEVGGVSFVYIVEKNLLLIVAGAIVLIVGGAYGYLTFGKQSKLKSMKRRRKELRSLQEELDYKYYNEGKLSKHEFKEFSEKYSAELDNLEELITELEGK